MVLDSAPLSRIIIIILYFSSHLSPSTINDAHYIQRSMERISQSSAHRHCRITPRLEFFFVPTALNSNEDIFTKILHSRRQDDTINEIDGPGSAPLSSIIIVLSSSRLHILLLLLRHHCPINTALASDSNHNILNSLCRQSIVVGVGAEEQRK